MIDYETYCQIKLLHGQKQLKAAQIADELQLDLKTVEKWIREEVFRPRKSPPRSSQLDVYKNQIIALLDRHPYTAQQNQRIIVGVASRHPWPRSKASPAGGSGTDAS